MAAAFVSDDSPDLQALLAAAADEPERDAPRLVLADWLEERSDPRATLIRVQCQLARLSDNSPRGDALREQEQEWLGRHLGAWLGGGKSNKDFSVHFARGLIQLYAEGWVLAEGKLPPKLRRAIEAGWVSQVHFRKCTNAQFSQVAEKGLLDRVTELILAGTQVSERGLTALARLDRLRSLSLSESKVTDTWADGWEGMPRLTALRLNELPITDLTLMVVRQWKGLRRLELEDTRATGAALAGPGVSCKRLEELSLAGSPVTDSALAGFGRLTKLRVLDLSRTKITDKGVKHLAGLTNLKELDLGQTRVSNRGLEHLAELDRLQKLVLCYTDVSSGAPALLAGLPRLRELDLEGTGVDEDDVADFAEMELRSLNLRATRVPQLSAWELESEMHGCEIICD